MNQPFLRLPQAARRLLICGAIVLVAAAATAAAQAARPLHTAVFYHGEPDGSMGVGLSNIRGPAGATFVKLTPFWSSVAGPTAPATPTQPNAPEYNWAEVDVQVRGAEAAGLEPILNFTAAPAWARPLDSTGPFDRPDPAMYADFMQAAAMRYSGTYDDPDDPDPALPEVRYWQVWNEPNLGTFYLPQLEDGKVVSPINYRRMVNRFTAAVKDRAGRPENVVIAGGTAPFGYPVGPLRFMRSFLCLRKSLKPRAGCGPARFDVWGHHAYTSGGPTREAAKADDVSLGDLPEMARVLRAADRAGKIQSSGAVGFWVDEFGWDTSPPDRYTVPTRLHARWVAEALYRMRRAGIQLLAWVQLSDNPFPANRYQAGLYFRSSTPYTRAKRALAAFRFPFVAFDKRGTLRVWGRVPPRSSGPLWVRGERVAIQLRTRSGWRHIRTLATNRHGIFGKRWRSPIAKGMVRARLTNGRATAVPFSLTRPPDRFLRKGPFGCGGHIPC